MIVFSLIMVSGIFFYKILTPSHEQRIIPFDLNSKKKMKFRFNGVNTNA